MEQDTESDESESHSSDEGSGGDEVEEEEDKYANIDCFLTSRVSEDAETGRHCRGPRTP